MIVVFHTTVLRKQLTQHATLHIVPHDCCVSEYSITETADTTCCFTHCNTWLLCFRLQYYWNSWHNMLLYNVPYFCRSYYRFLRQLTQHSALFTVTNECNISYPNNWHCCFSDPNIPETGEQLTQHAALHIVTHDCFVSDYSITETTDTTCFFTHSFCSYYRFLRQMTQHSALFAVANDCYILYPNNWHCCFSDPNIPETGEQLTRSTHATTCCFTHCKGHKLCLRPSPNCAPDDTPPSFGDNYCTSGHTVTSSSCSHSTSSSANCVKKPLNLLLFAIVITVGHLLLTLKIDRLLLCRKRTTVRFK